MLFLYNLSIQCYFVLIYIFSFFNTKAQKWTDGRKNIFNQIQSALQDNHSPIIWFHTASLGEFEQGKPVIEHLPFNIEHLPFSIEHLALKIEYLTFNQQSETSNLKPETSNLKPETSNLKPETSNLKPETSSLKPKILITFFSPSGFEVRKNYQGADYVFYLPLDTPRNAKKFLDLVKPSAVFFVKYEFWFHFLHETQKRKIPLILFSAIFREKQIFFKWYGGLFRKLLKGFSHIFVQNEESKVLLNKIKIEQVSIAGDTRFDNVLANKTKAQQNRIAEYFKNEEKLLIVGSCWSRDLDMLIPFLNEWQKPLKVIIAPHEIKEQTLQRLEKEIRWKSIRYSQAQNENWENLKNYEILLIDNVGMLANLYQYGDFAYIGGAFGEGLHNILEPAVFGLPVFFGKQYKKFPEALDLIRLGGAFSVQNTHELRKIFTEIYLNEALRKSIGEICFNYIQNNQGGAEKIVQFFVGNR